MKECKKVKKLLSLYVDDELNNAQSEFVKGHLAHCVLCSREYSEFAAVKQAVSEKQRKSLPEDYMIWRLREKIAQQHYVNEKPSWLAGMGNLSRKFIPIPATVIVFALVLMVLSYAWQATDYSLDEQLLSGSLTTTETATRVILGEQS